MSFIVQDDDHKLSIELLLIEIIQNDRMPNNERHIIEIEQ